MDTRRLYLIITTVVSAIEQAGGSAALTERLQTLEAQRARVQAEGEILDAQLAHVGTVIR